MKKQEMHCIKVVLYEKGTKKPPRTIHLEKSREYTDETLRQTLDNIGFMNMEVIDWKPVTINLITI